MMMSSTPPPPPATNNDLVFIASMLAVLSHPDQSRKRLQDMLEARQAWTAARDEAMARMRESDAKVADNQATIAKAVAEHSAKLRDAQASHDQKCAAAYAEIQAMQAKTKKLNDQARADSTKAAKLTADLEARISILRQAGV